MEYKFSFNVGDLVEFHVPVHPDARPTKHTEGWIGPATVVDTTQISRGQITVKYRLHYREIESQRSENGLGTGLKKHIQQAFIMWQVLSRYCRISCTT